MSKKTPITVAHGEGIDPAIMAIAWASLRRTKLFCKAPVTTPRGGGYKSLNVTTRKRCCFDAIGKPVTHAGIAGLHHEMTAAGYDAGGDAGRTERLRNLDDNSGFTLAQGR